MRAPSEHREDGPHARPTLSERALSVLGTWPGKLAALVLTGIIGSGIAYAFGANFWHGVSKRIGTAAPPLRVQVITDPDQFRSGVVDLPEFVIRRPIGEIPAPPSGNDSAGRYAWAHRLGAVDAGESVVRLTLSATSGAPVILQNARLVVVGRHPPIRDGAFISYAGQGAPQSVRYFDANLDRQPPELQYIGSRGGPEARFPLKVTEAESEIFDVYAHTEACLCAWVVDLTYTADGEDRTVRVDDHGRPFELTPGFTVADLAGESLGGTWAPTYVWQDQGWVEDVDPTGAVRVCRVPGSNERYTLLVTEGRCAIARQTLSRFRRRLASGRTQPGSAVAVGTWVCESPTSRRSGRPRQIASCRDLQSKGRLVAVDHAREEP